MSTRRKKNQKKKEHKEAVWLVYLMIFCPFLTGLAENYQVYFVSILLVGAVYVKGRMQGFVRIWLGVPFFAGTGILLCSMGTVFCGVSRGDAAWGVLRVLSILIYGVLLMQYDRDKQWEALAVIPDVGVLMLLICGVLYLIPGAGGSLISGAGRPGGFFQYPNTFALYLLLGIVIHAEDIGNGKKSWKDDLYPLILWGGICWTGSRITFVMSVATFLYLAIRQRNVRRPYLGILITGVLAASFLAVVTGNNYSVGRFLTLFSRTSTLMGRILYAADGLRMLARHPLGMGYYGYFLMQPYEQTGVYTVKFVHNDWLQAALDYGVAAGILFAGFMIFAVQNARGTRRLLLLLIGLHAAFDFDLQFMVMVWIVLLCIDWEDGRRVERLWACGKRRWLQAGVVALAAGSCLWLGTADLFRAAGQYDTALRIYPWAVVTEEYAMAEKVQHPEQMERHADHILAEFGYAGIAYEAKALAQEQRGNYMEMVQLQRNAVLCEKYDMRQYERYVAMLREAITYFEEEGRLEERQECIRCLLELPALLEDVKEHTNPLTYRTVDAPDFKLSDEAMTYIEGETNAKNDSSAEKREEDSMACSEPDSYFDTGFFDRIHRSLWHSLFPKPMAACKGSECVRR